MPLKIQGQRLDPTRDQADAKELPRKKAPGRPNFWAGHLPKRWDFDDTIGRFVPSLSTIVFSAGVQGCRARKPGPNGEERLDTAGVLQHFRDKGGVAIDPADPRLGPYRGYQQRVKNDAGAEINFSIFESYDVIGNDVWWDHNADEYRKFQQQLLDEGVIPPIHPRVKQHRIGMQERDVRELQKRYGNMPSHEGLASELEYAIGRLRAMREEIPTADALALIKAEQRAGKEVEAPALIKAEQPATDVRTIDDELAEARAYLDQMKAEHPDVYKRVIGRKRPQVAAIERVRDYIAAIEDAIDEAEAAEQATTAEKAPEQPAAS